MAAASADREALRQDGELKGYKVKGSTTIYKGTLVGVNAAGYALPMSDTAGLIFVGVAYEKVANTGSDGDKTCRVHKKGEFEFAYAGGDASIARVGDVVLAQDDQTVDEDAALTTNEYRVGVVTEYISAAKVRVRIDNHVDGGIGGGAAAGGAVADLTDNSGGAAADGTIGVVTLPTAITNNSAGTADGTLEALPDPADTPGTADALRDDLVANVLPVIRNYATELATRQAENRTAHTAERDAIKELAAKVNAILAALRTAGIISQ